jgi:exosortase
VLPLFAIPLPFLASTSPYLQALAANGAAALVSAVGIPVQQDVITLTAAGIPFQIAPLCSGLTSVVSLTFVTFFAVTAVGLPRPWQASLLAAAVPLAVVANLVRITLVILVAVHWSASAAEGFFHGASDVVLYLVALAPLLWVVAHHQRRPAHG